MKKQALTAAAVLLLVSCGTFSSTSTSSSTTSRSVIPERSVAPESFEAPIEEVAFPGPPPWAPLEGSVTEDRSGGSVDWSSNVVRASGTGVVDPSNPNTAQARLMAERAAVTVARRNLLEIIQGVRVDSETRVENFMTDYDVIYTRVQGMVRNARQTGPARYDSEAGTVEVELSMEIYGAGGLSGALVPAMTGPETFRDSLSPQVRDFLQQYSGLVIDGGSTGLTPSMFPKIFDQEGNLLLDTGKYAQYLGSETGMILRFISDLEGILQDYQGAGAPLVLRAVQAAGSFGSDIVVSAEDIGGGLLKQALPYLLSAGRFLLRVIL